MAGFNHSNMVPIDSKNPDPIGDTELMVVEWDILNMWLNTSKIPDGISRSDVLRELENRRVVKMEKHNVSTTNTGHQTESTGFTSFINDWVDHFHDNELDLVLATSSLTEGSEFSFSNNDDSRDDGTNSSNTSNEANGNSSKNEDSFKRENLRIDYNGKTTSESRTSNIKRFPPAKRDNISYAQLFFDPETKTLVTLMEVANSNEPGGGCGGKNSKYQHCFVRQKDYYLRRGTPLHRSSLLLQKNDTSSFATKESKKTNDRNEEWVNIPFLDKTLLTECSSISSEASHLNDDDDNEDWGFHGMAFDHDLPCETAKTRYPDEPIVFSNDESMDHQLCWLEEAEIDLYLLHDCDDVWDYGATKDSRCTDSLKKLLTASRLCISLPSIGESKWKASTSNNNSGADFSDDNNNKDKLERTPYSALNDT